MPLHVTVDINSTNIGKLHIGRLDDLYSAVQVSRYVAWVGGFNDALTEKNSAHFYHKYDEGALTCVRKGIEALQENGVTI